MNDTILQDGAGFVKSAPHTSPQLEKVLAAFNEHGKKGAASDVGEWMYQCPGHDDQRASLSISETAGGTVLLHCFACGGEKEAKERILHAVGLTWSDLFVAKKKGASWTYVSADETAAWLKTRTIQDGDKTYRWFHWSDTDKAWVSGIGDEKPPLFKLPQLLDAVKANVPIHIAEGEKCCEALLGLGFMATTSGGGAGNLGWLTPAFLEVLRGADVVLWPDADEPGRKYADTFGKRLVGIAKSITLVQWPPDMPKGFDVADLISDGAGKSNIIEIVEASEPYVAAAEVEVEVAGTDTPANDETRGDIAAAIRYLADTMRELGGLPRA